MIETRGLSKRYRDQSALEDVSFRVEEGEIVGFLGPNGAGKSTCMKILSAFLPASAGSATIAGFDTFEQPLEVKRNLGYMPETPPLYEDLSIQEYLRFVARIKGLDRGRREHSLEQILTRLGLDGSIKQRLIRNLSKGFKQRVSLAQALLGEPKVILLDEPTNGLDPRQIDEFRSILRERSKTATILLSTHILQEVTALCERVIVLNQGKIVADRPLEYFLAQGSASDYRDLEKVFLSLTTAP